MLDPVDDSEEAGQRALLVVVIRVEAVCGSTAEVAPDDVAVLVRRQLGNVSREGRDQSDAADADMGATTRMDAEKRVQ